MEIDRKLVSVNDLLPRQEYTIQHKALADQIAVNSARLSALEARNSTQKEQFNSSTAILVIAISAVSLLVSLGGVLTDIVVYHGMKP